MSIKGRMQHPKYEQFFNYGKVTWDPGSLVAGAQESKDVTVTGAELGDFSLCSFSVDVVDLILNAQVTAADTVTCVLANETAGTVDLASGTLRAMVFKYFR